jgi:hypothetical protein
MNRLRVLLPLSLVAFSLALLAGCGGGGGEDPQQVLDDTFSNGQQAASGVLDLTIDGKAEGGTGGTASLSLSGPFQGAGEANTLPQVDLTAKATANAAGQSFSFDGGLVLTADNGYVVYQGQAYEVGKSSFSQVQQLLQSVAAAQTGASTGAGAGSSTTTTSTAKTPSEAIIQSCELAASQNGGDPSACNIDFSGWTTNLSNEGTTDIDGTSTIHIHGDFDVPKIIDGFIQISQAAAPSGTAVPAPSSDQLQQISSAITNASFDVYTGESDHIVRGLDFNVTIDPSSIPGASVLGISSVSLSFQTRLSQVNQPQTIQAPANPKPISELLKQFPSLGGLGALGGIPGGGAVPSIPGLPSAPQ